MAMMGEPFIRLGDTSAYHLQAGCQVSARVFAPLGHCRKIARMQFKA
jgi:hypothetical protein